LELSAENKKLLWIPAGLAHGFLVTSETAEFLYKTTDFYYAEYERFIVWNEPVINIAWPRGLTPRLSDKDQAGLSLTSAGLLR
jgi:dTDP-4-dehydrorhamnose 3,5-epimerase